MAIVLNGKKLTEAWLNGKKLKEAWINGHRVFPEHEDKKMIRITIYNNEHIPFTVSLDKLYFVGDIVKSIYTSIHSTGGEDTVDFDASEVLKDFEIKINNKPYMADWSITCEMDGTVYMYHNKKLAASLNVKKNVSYPFSTNDSNDINILYSDSSHPIGFNMGIIEISKTASGIANLSFNDIVEKTPSSYWYNNQYWSEYWYKTGDSDNYVMTAKGSDCYLSFTPRSALEDQNPIQVLYVFTINMSDCDFGSFMNCEEFYVGDGDYIEVFFVRSELNNKKFTMKVRYVSMSGYDSSEESCPFSLDSNITIMYSYENLTVSELGGDSWTYDVGGISDFGSRLFKFPENTRMTDASVTISL